MSRADPFSSLNDGKYCTSFTGTEVGPDHCVNGNCVGNPVKDKEDTEPVTTTYDIPGLVNKILEWIEKAGLGNKVELVGKLDLTVQTFKRCCEEKNDVLEGKKKTIGGSVKLKNKELVNQVVRIIPRVGTINAIADIDGSYSLSAEVKGEPCKNEQGNWSGGGSVAASIAGGYTFEPITDYLYDLTDISGKLESKLSGSITVSGTEGKVALSFNGVTAVGTLNIKGLGGISIPIKIIEGGDLGSLTFPMP